MAAKVSFERLSCRIREKGVTQSFLCSLAGKKRQYISDARKGNGSISEEALAIFAKALDTTVEWLSGTGEQKEQIGVIPEEALVDAIIMGRDGKTIRRKYPKEELSTLYRLLDLLPHTDEEL